MLAKILLTALVIAAAIFAQRMSGARRAEPQVVRVVQAPPQRRSAPAWLRPAAYGFAVFIAGSSALWYFTTWQDDQRVVTIRVIDTGSGQTATYRAHKGEVTGRSFVTVDGLMVRIADSDRVEVLNAVSE